METEAKPKVKHAWFSAEMERLGGSNWYRREGGEEVLVTAVAESIESAPCWDDLQYLGEVVEWVRSESRGRLPQYTPEWPRSERMLDIPYRFGRFR
jgi:formylglycine-generating enzyme required for sulfatase activity